MNRRQRAQWRLSVMIWLLVCIVSGLIAALPLPGLVPRVALLFTPLLFWLGGFVLFWRWIAVRLLFLAPAAAVLLTMALPPVAPDNGALRQAYASRLRAAATERGGATRWGEDGAGLVRRALMQSCWNQALRRRDLGPARSAASLWWSDASAQEMADSSYEKTRRIGDAASRRDAAAGRITGPYGAPKLVTGDLAVSADGRRIWAYLDDGQWASYDPVSGRVVVGPADKADPPGPVRLLRWKRLE